MVYLFGRYALDPRSILTKSKFAKPKVHFWEFRSVIKAKKSHQNVFRTNGFQLRVWTTLVDFDEFRQMA